MLVNLVKELLSTTEGRDLLSKHGFLPTEPASQIQPKVTVEQVIAVLKLVCDGAAVACPVIQSLP